MFQRYLFYIAMVVVFFGCSGSSAKAQENGAPEATQQEVQHLGKQEVGVKQGIFLFYDLSVRKNSGEPLMFDGLFKNLTTKEWKDVTFEVVVGSKDKPSEEGQTLVYQARKV